MNTQQVTRFLGWFSVGLGLAELLAPRKLGRAIGIPHHHGVLPLLGLREIASGVGILTQSQPAPWLWSRVAGDIMDLGLLGAAARAEGADRRRIQTALASVALVSVLDVICSAQSSRERAENRDDSAGFGTRVRRGTAEVCRSVTIGRPAQELYEFWRKLDRLPQFMWHLEDVRVIDDTHSHWVAQGPLGSSVEWDAEITADRPGELIAWRSLPGSSVETEGRVRFEPASGGRGTVVRVDLRYRPPAGVLGATIAKLLGEAPEKQVPNDLRRFKQLIETGEIARTEGQPAGRARSTSRKFDDLVRA